MKYEVYSCLDWFIPTGNIVFHKKRVRSLRFLDKKVPRINQKYILARKGKAKNGRENEVGDNFIAENVRLLRKKESERQVQKS